MNEHIEKQIQRNRDAAGKWPHAEQHRRIVTDEILRGFKPEDRARLCVLGAGNCNDIDLARLCETFAEVHLVDLDGDAMAAAVNWQDPPHANRVHYHGGVDLTGVFDELGKLKHAVDVLPLLSDFHLSMLDGPFDMVVSLCTLSQLIEAVALNFGEDDEHFLDVVTAVRRQHIRLMTELTAPGGVGLLVFDFSSSDAAPIIVNVTPPELAKLSAQLVAQRNHFHGLSPPAVASVFDQDEKIKPHIAKQQLIKPWRWNNGSRIYLVSAVKYIRK